MKKNNNWIMLIIIPFLLIFLFINTVFAQDCSGTPDDGQGCQNGGNLTNGCNWICNTVMPDIKYVMPPCCETLAATGDPFACCFDARRRCTPQQCSSISGAQQRCGQLWTGDYNCPQTMQQPIATPTKTVPSTPAGPPFVGCTLAGDWLCMCLQNGEYLHDCAPATSDPQKSYQTMCGGDLSKAEKQWRYDVSMGFTKKGDCCNGQNVCKPSPIPTQIPIPTNQPIVTQIQPTSTIPTTRLLPLPTDEPHQIIPTTPLFPSPINNITSQSNSLTFSFPQINFPKITLPSIDPLQIVIKTNTIAYKPMKLFENIFRAIQQVDQSLEHTMNYGLEFLVRTVYNAVKQ